MGGSGFQPLVTVSASYGSAGSLIAPRLAERLGLRFIDRAISFQLSERAAAAACGPSQEHLTESEKAATPGGRILGYFARAASAGAMLAPGAVVDTDEVLRGNSQVVLSDVAAGAAGLVLGHGGAVVLATRPNAFHIRLDGPVERRIARAAELTRENPERCRGHQWRTDRARTEFVKRLYRADPGSPRWYHLVLDTTAFPIEASVELLAAAAERFFAARTAAPGSGGC